MNFKSISKITFYSISSVILLTIDSIVLAYTFDDWIKYGNEYLNGDPNFVLPVIVQAYRALLMLILTLFVSVSLLSLWEMTKIEEKKTKIIYFLSSGFFTWILLPYTLTLGLKNKSYSEFWSYLKTKKDAIEQINISKWFSSFKKKKDLLFWNTSLFIFLILIVLVDFALIWVTTDYAKDDPNSNIMFNKFSYFTLWTNFAIIFFVFLFLFAHQTIIFRRNTLLILMATYITIVGVVFWSFLIPFGNIEESYGILTELVKTIWLHFITPVVFVAFAICSLFVSKEEPSSYFKTAALSGPYPMIYGMYAYSLSFVTRHSVYGSITNLNPNMVDWRTGIVGNPLNIFYFFMICATFYLFCFIFWKISYIAYKKGLKVEETVDKRILMN
ncbi:MAG: DUF1600 domain-containing protein [Metamycoplasmataceae bacterium]